MHQSDFIFLDRDNTVHPVHQTEARISVGSVDTVVAVASAAVVAVVNPICRPALRLACHSDFAVAEVVEARMLHLSDRLACTSTLEVLWADRASTDL